MTRTGVAPIQRYPLSQYPLAPYPSTQRLKLSEQLHGRAVARTVALVTDQLCFLAQHTGLDQEAAHTR